MRGRTPTVLPELNRSNLAMSPLLAAWRQGAAARRLAAPIIMMSQNRQAQIDRRRAIDDLDINRKAELEIETLHQKIDLMRETEIATLTASVGRSTLLLEGKGV